MAIPVSIIIIKCLTIWFVVKKRIIWTGIESIIQLKSLLEYLGEDDFFEGKNNLPVLLSSLF
jgi:hypothetical protein